MNNQRRHELERNVLAEKMGEGYGKVQPVFKPILMIAAAALLGFLGYQFISSQQSQAESKNWTDYYFNQTSAQQDAESLAALADEFGAKPSGQWTYHSAAQVYLREGSRDLFTNRKQGTDSIRKAIKLWEKVKDSSISELQLSAKLGLAEAHESLGELDAAVKYYQAVADVPGASDDQKKRLNERIAYLKSADAKSFYDWFAKLDPKPTAPPVFSGDLGLPPTTPSISLDPGKLPDFSNPSIAPSSNPPPSQNPTAPNTVVPGLNSTPSPGATPTPEAPVKTDTPPPTEPPAGTPSASPTSEVPQLQLPETTQPTAAASDPK